jgi:flagellar hook-associated protein 2
MISSVNFGQFVTVNGKTVSTGSQSGIDTNTLIEDLVNARSITVNGVIERQDLVNSQITSFGSFNTLFSNFQSSLGFLRNPPGFDQDSANVFQFRQAFLTSSDGSSPANFLSVTAQAGASIGAREIEILNLAESKQLRTADAAAFSSKTGDAVAAGELTAGTFSITSQLRTASEDTLLSADYTVSGTGVGIVGAAGIENITAVAAGGPSELVGAISGFSATIDGTNVDISVTVNGRTFTADDVVANDGPGNRFILAQNITFSDSDGNTFDVVLGSDVNINADQANADAFAADLDTDLAGISIFQTKTLANVTVARAEDTVLEGLNQSNVSLFSDGFDGTNGAHGAIGEFTVTGVTLGGAGDATISVVIDGETYENIALGDDADDTEVDNIVLTSTTTNKTLSINIADAGLTLDFSDTEGAQAIEDALNATFGAFSADITVGADDSLTDLRNAINGQSTVTGVSAIILQAGEGDFRLSLSSDATGLESAFTLDGADPVFGASAFETVQDVEDSLITVDGLNITRASNSVSDALEDVTITLFQETDPGVIINADIDKDVNAVVNQVLEFVAQYNELRIFISEQSQRDEDGQLLETAVLGSNSTVTALQRQLSGQLNAVVGGLGSGSLSTLAELGITFTDLEADVSTETSFTRNVLTVDQTKLQAAVQANFEEVRNVFEFRFSSDADDRLAVSARTNALSINEFELDIDDSRLGDEVRVTFGATTVNADFETSGTGYVITGRDGTAIEGLQFIYTGDGTDVINVSVTQGIGDRLFNLAQSATEEDTGTIATAVDGLSESDDRLQNDIDRLNAQLETFRLRLFDRFNAVESALASVNSTLQLLEAQDNAFQAANS